VVDGERRAVTNAAVIAALPGSDRLLSGALGRIARTVSRPLMPSSQPSSGIDDVQLLERCAAGDEDALGLLYDRFGRTAFALSFRIVRDRELAEDAVQESFLAAWRRASSFDPARAKVSTWLFTIVRNKSVDLVRREESRPSLTSDEALREEPSGIDVEAQVTAHLGNERVHAALSALSPRDREVLELAYFGGLTQSELAARLQEPIGTIKSRTHAALGKLRRLLAGEEGLRSI
jgi:RNA polymerase sigma-70 factor (ECF subfamily)